MATSPRRSFRTFLHFSLAVIAAYHVIVLIIAARQSNKWNVPGGSNYHDAPYDFDNLTAPPRSSSRAVPSSSSIDSAEEEEGKDLLYSHPTPNYELQQLVSSHSPKYNCSHGLIYVHDHILPDNITHANTKIPRLLHFTSKSRCMTKAFVNNMHKWKLTLGSKYSIYIHDDIAVDKFIYQRRWLEFPELQEVMACVSAGAAKADIWRYLMIWEYGGIYSDFDSAPNKFNVDTITNDDDAWFPLEKLGIPAQYWFAASPRHPIMYFSAKQALRSLSWRTDIGSNNAAKTTGPNAFKIGFIYFQRLVGNPSTGYVTEGLYHGIQNRTVKVVGTKESSNEWIIRETIVGKGNQYGQMGMTHFHGASRKFNEMHSGMPTMGCLVQRYKMHTDVMFGWNNIV
jgi:hypothetical protein